MNTPAVCDGVQRAGLDEIRAPLWQALLWRSALRVV